MKFKSKLLYLAGASLLFFAGCKHVEKVVIEKKLRPMSVRRVVRLVAENELSFQTLSVKKVNIDINLDGDEHSIGAKYKIKKDSVIQISAQKLTVPVGKLEIDPDSFRLVDHINKQLMLGQIQKIGEKVGYDIDYQTIQAILSNHLQSLRPDARENQFKDYVIAIEQSMYKISSLRERKFKKFVTNGEKLERFKQRKDEEHLVKQDIFVDPDLFVIRKVVFHDIDYDRVVTIDFSDFKEVGSRWFPGKIHAWVNGPKKMDLVMEISRVTVDDETDFGFSIPSKYKEQDLK